MTCQWSRGICVLAGSDDLPVVEGISGLAGSDDLSVVEGDLWPRGE